MKHFTSLIALFSLVFGLVSCTPTIDGTSEEAFTASYQKVMDDVPEKDKLRVKAAFAVFKVKKTLEATLEGTLSASGIQKKVYAAMDGKTANDILVLTGQDKITEEKE